MRIRQVFLLSIALGSAVGAMAALLFALQQWGQLQAAWRVEHDTHLLVSALHLPETMNMERAFINPRLVEPAPATSPQLATIRHQTGLVDAALAETHQWAAGAADRDALQAFENRLLDIRRGAMADVVRPQAERSKEVDKAYLGRMFGVQESAYAFATAIEQRINASNPSVGLAARLAVLSWDVRDWSGRQTTTLIGYIARHLPMAGEQAEVLAEFRGRIEQKWTAARSFAAQLNRPALNAAVAGVERDFWGRGGEAYATWVVPNRGQNLELDADAFVIAIRPILDSLLPLRDVALADALHQAATDIGMHRLRFLLALGLVVLTAGTAGASTWWFDRRVVRPTRDMTTTILNLASGNRAVAVPFQCRTDELGQMAQAIETLRRNAIQADAIARDMLELQHARAEEKSRLLAELTRSHENLAALNLELESLAATDALTGVANRRCFDRVLGHEWRLAQREAKPLGLLLLDIDHFKAYNDRYGHPAGDACLARVAAAVAGALRRPTDVPARYGGEEFAVVLPATALDGAVSVAETIRRAVSGLQIPHVGNPLGVVTVSIGVCAAVPEVSACSDCPETLLQATDSALYAAKHGGRNRVATAEYARCASQCGVAAAQPALLDRGRDLARVG